MKPIPILSVDFKEIDKRNREKMVDDLSLSVFKTFSTPDGKRTLQMLDDMTSGSMVVTNVHQTVANAAQRDLVTGIHDMIARAKEELENNE